jgi:hypothetical protein
LDFVGWEGGGIGGGERSGGLEEGLEELVVAGKDGRADLWGELVKEIGAERRWLNGLGGEPSKGGSPFRRGAVRKAGL